MRLGRDIIMDIIESRDGKRLGEAFNWEKTPQGRYYWASICRGDTPFDDDVVESLKSLMRDNPININQDEIGKVLSGEHPPARLEEAFHWVDHFKGYKYWYEAAQQKELSSETRKLLEDMVDGWQDSFVPQFVIEAIAEDSPDMLGFSFNWELMPEGREYWKKVAEKDKFTVSHIKKLVKYCSEVMNDQ